MTDPCCDWWPRIRPLLGWFQVDPPDSELICPVIGQPVPGAPRVNFCPSCGAPVREAKWTLEGLTNAV